MKLRKEEFRTCESYSGGSVERCVNLLPDEFGRLRSVPMPAIAGEGGLEALLTHVDADGRTHQFFCESERSAGGYVIKTRSEGEWKTAGVTAGKLQCGLSLNSEEVAVSDGEGMTVFSWQGNRWIQHSGGEGLCCDITTGVAHSVVSAQSGTFELKTNGDRTVSLSDGARDEIRRRLGKMYETMCGVASNSGLWMQPVVVQVRVINRNGRVIYRGLPRVIAPHGWQCVESITSGVSVGEGSVTVNDLRAEARSYYIEVGFNGELDSEASFVEVLVSRQFHPVDPSAEVAARLVVHSSGSNVTVAMPGATYNFGQRTGEWGYGIARICASVESEGYVAARIDASRFSDGCKVRINALPWSLSSELDRQKAAATVAGEKHTGNYAGVMEKINGGARWGAGFCASSGSSVVFADIRLSAPEPPHPLQIAGTFTDYEGEWQAVTVVETSDGECVAKSFDGNGAWPSSIAPMACCPWSRATIIRLFVELETGETFMAEAGLTPDPDGGATAVYLDSALKGKPLEETDSAMPPESRGRVERHAGMILSADACSPLVICAERVCGSVVNALCRSVKSRDSWETGRARFYAFTPQGVSAVSVSGNSRTIGATTVCDAVVENRMGAVVTPKGVYATGGGRLWNLRGTGAVCVESDFKGVTIGWCGVLEQLWSVDRQGNTQIRKLLDNGEVAWRTELPLPYAPKLLTDTSDGMYICSDAATLFLGCDAEREAGAYVEMRVGLTAPRGMRAVELQSVLNASEFSGAIDLIADGGAGTETGRCVCSLGLDGSINQPFGVRLLCDRHHRFTLCVSGNVSVDMFMGSFELMFSK